MNDIVEEIKLFKTQQQEEDDTVETESYDITDLIDCVNLHAYMIKESFEYENLTVDELEFYIESTLEMIREEADVETDSLVDGVEEAYENNKTNPNKTVFIDPDAIETMKDFRDFKRELDSGNVKNKYKRLVNDSPSFIPKSLQVPDYWKKPSARLKEKESLVDASKRTRKELDELKERIDKKGHTVGDKDLTDLDNFIVDNLSDAHKGQLTRLKSIKASDGSFGKRYKMEYFGDTDFDFLDIYYESDNGTADGEKQGRIKLIINKIKAFVQRLIQRYRMWRGKKYTEKIEKSLKDPQMRENLSKKKISGKYILDDTTVNYIKEADDLLSGLYDYQLYDNHQNIDAYANKLDDFSARFLKYYENTWKVTKKTDTVLHQYELAKELTPLLNHMMRAVGQKFCGEYLELTKDDKDVVINRAGEYAGQRILTFLNRIWMITDMVQKNIRYSVTYFNSQNPDWIDNKPNNSVNNSSELEDVPDLTPPTDDDFYFDDPGDLDAPDDDNPQDPTTEYSIEDYYMADPFLEMMQVDLYQEDGIGSKIKMAIQALIAKIKSMIKTFRAKRTVAYIDKMKNIIHDTKKAENAKKKMSKKSWNHDMIMAVLARCDIIVKSWGKAMSNNQPADVVDQIYDEIIKSFESIKDIKYEYSDQPISLYQFCRWCVEEYNSLGVLMTNLDDMEFGIRDHDYYAYEDEEILKKAVALFKTILTFVDELMVGNQKIINSVTSQLELDPSTFRKLVSDGEPPKDDDPQTPTGEYAVDENNNDIYNEGVDTMSNYESYETDDITIDDVDAYIESMTDNLNNAKTLRDQMVQEETEYEDYKCEFVNTNDFVFESDTEELLTDAEFFDESYEPDNSPLINASNNCIQFYQEFTLAELMGVGAIIGGCIAMIKPFLDLKKFGRFPKDLMRVFEIVKSENFEASENKKALKKALKAVSKDLNYLTGPYAGTATWTVNERKELRELARITNNIVHGGAYGTSILRKNKKMSDAFRVPARLKEFVEQSEKVLKLLKKRDEELDAAGVSKKYQLRTGAADAITEWMV